MNGIIIVNQELGHNEYKIKRFYDEFLPLGVNLKVYVNDGSLAVIKNNKMKINLPKSDFVLYLDKDIYLARELEKAGYRLFNKADFIKLCDDKMLTNICCSNLNIKMPKTIAGPLVYNDKLDDKNYNFLNYVGEQLNYPYVFKRVYGSLGEGVYLVNNLKEAKNLYSKFFRSPLQFQEYISSSKGQSMRVIIIDKKPIGAFIRYNRNDFRSNYGEEASSKASDIPPQFIKFAQKIAHKLNIEYAGIDLLFGKDNEPILCEINSNAFFEEFEKVTKINVAKLFAEMVIKKIEYEQK